MSLHQIVDKAFPESMMNLRLESGASLVSVESASEGKRNLFGFFGSTREANVV